MPQISIVTPSYNQAQFLEQCLRSVKEQGHPSVEHIIVDGASTDGSAEILKKYSALPGWEHLRWISEPDRGQSDALNKGFRMAKGKIVGWLNADDYYRPGCFSAIVEGFSIYHEADVLYGDYLWIDKNGHALQLRREIAFNRFILLYHKTLYIPSTSTFFRRRIFEENNWIDINFRYAMDYEFFVRLARKGYKFKHIGNLLANFRWYDHKPSIADIRLKDELKITLNMHSPLLQRVGDGLTRSIILGVLQSCAGVLRYSEKFARGYYFTQFWPNAR